MRLRWLENAYSRSLLSPNDFDPRKGQTGLGFGMRSGFVSRSVQARLQVSQDSVATLFRWDRRRLNYCIVNLFRTMCTKFYQNRLGFVEDMTKTFRCVFSVLSVVTDCRRFYPLLLPFTFACLWQKLHARRLGENMGHWVPIAPLHHSLHRSKGYSSTEYAAGLPLPAETCFDL